VRDEEAVTSLFLERLPFDNFPISLLHLVEAMGNQRTANWGKRKVKARNEWRKNGVEMEWGRGGFGKAKGRNGMGMGKNDEKRGFVYCLFVQLILATVLQICCTCPLMKRSIFILSFILCPTHRSRALKSQSFNFLIHKQGVVVRVCSCEGNKLYNTINKCLCY